LLTFSKRIAEAVLQKIANFFRSVPFFDGNLIRSSEASAGDHPWPERSLRSDSLEHDSRGWKEPSLPGGRPCRARDRLPVISSGKAAMGLVNILDLPFDRARSHILGGYMRRIVIADENESAYRVIR
jgi:hypothetical protein